MLCIQGETEPQRALTALTEIWESAWAAARRKGPSFRSASKAAAHRSSSDTMRVAGLVGGWWIGGGGGWVVEWMGRGGGWAGWCWVVEWIGLEVKVGEWVGMQVCVGMCVSPRPHPWVTV